MGLGSVYNNLGELIERGGWAPESARDRQIYNGAEYDDYFTKPDMRKDLKKRDGAVTDTVRLMKIVIKTKSQQVDRLAKQVLAVTNADGSLNIRRTVENIFNFIFRYIKYNIEEGEQLQSPRHTWWRAQVLARTNPSEKNSADCDCMSIFAGSCMYRLGIPFALKVAGYQPGVYQHVYCVAYDGATPIICDPVTNHFNYEKTPVISEIYPISSNMSGTPIYVLDGIDLPQGIQYKENPDGGLSVVGDLGKKSDKKAKKAAKKQAKAEKKAAKKAAKAEKKAEKKAAKAEKKAEKKQAKAEKKAAKKEKKAEKAAAKGNTKKAEKLQKKADAIREAGEVKAEAIREKAATKAENKQKKINEKLAKKTAKLEVKKLKAEGASKEEIKAAKQHLKDVKKEIRQARKEDGRGVLRKFANGAKSVGMAPVRGAFLMLMRINFRGLATRLYENPEAYSKFVQKWKKIFGGKEAKLKVAITRGQAMKALFGSKKTNQQISEAAAELAVSPEAQEAVSGIFARLGATGAEEGASAAVIIATASSALTAAVAVLKACGVNVPEDVEEAVNAGMDVMEIAAGQNIPQDPDLADEDGTPSTPTKAQEIMRKVTDVSNTVKTLVDPDDGGSDTDDGGEIHKATSSDGSTTAVSPAKSGDSTKEEGMSTGTKVGLGLGILALLGLGIWALSGNDDKKDTLSGYTPVSLL